MAMATRKPVLVVIALIFALMISMIPAGSAPMASSGDVLFNGGFEQGFQAIGGCGMVGTGWGCFNNGGAAVYGFYDDMWQPVVYAGGHSQLVEINTKQMGGDADRNAGIFQSVNVQPGVPYELSLKGMIRADDHGGDPWRYRVFVGFDYSGGVNWSAVSDWRELPWDTYYPRLSPGAFSSYSTKVTPTTGRLTVFVRLQRKWGDWYEETDLNLDAISLFGPVGYPPVVEPPIAKPPIVHPPVVYPPIVQPPVVTQPTLVCDGPNLLVNGNFEHGFQPSGVANYWASFTSGGRANYGFYDEQWPPVVSEGKHGQLIEINTLGVNPADPDRKAGIYQWVYLQPGATYEISLDAMRRERGDYSGEDAYRYLVEWGYSKDGAANPAALTYHNMVKLDTIYERTAPGALQSYSERFTAPSQLTTIWVYAVKKWATVERELDVNLDNIALRMCRTVAQPPVVYPPIVHPPIAKPPVYPKPSCTVPAKYPCTDPGDIWYQVQRGDTLSALAARYNTSVAAIMAKNGLTNPNLIYVGQWLCIPDPPASTAAVPSAPAAPVAAAPKADVIASTAAAPTVTAQVSTVESGAYRVQRGDTLSGVAAKLNTTVADLMTKNSISNPNFIYVGQVLQLP
jgi:LysM repeat protein